MNKNVTNEIEVNDYDDSFTQDAPKKDKKGHGIRTAVIIILCALLLIAAGVITVAVLAFQTPNSDKFGASPDNGAIMNVIYAAIKDEDAEITNTELNSLLTYFIKGDKDDDVKPLSENSRIKDAAIYIHKDKPSELYAMVEINNHTFEISAELNIEPEIIKNEFKLTVTSAKIGNLPIAPDLLMNYAFSDDISNGISDYIRRDGNDLYIKSRYQYEIMGQTIKFSVKSFEPLKDGIKLKTTSAADILLGSISSWLSSFFQ